MTTLRIAMLTSAALAIAAASATEEWKTETLRGEKGLTVAIPAVAVNKANANNPDNLLFFSVEAPMHGSLVCMAHRTDYPKDVTRAAFAAALATERRETFCENDSKTVSGLDIGGSSSFERNGSQGAICTASFTDTAAKAPGQVQSQMIIAAPAKVYFLTCLVEDEDQEVAEYEWVNLWGEKVRHIQESFRVPE